MLRCCREPEECVDAAIESTVLSMDIGGETGRVRFTDNTAQPCLQTVRHAALGSAHVVLLCFAVNSAESLQRLKDTHAQLYWSTGSEAPVFVVGLKGDYRGAEGRGCIREDECDHTAHQLGALGYLECSAVYPETVHAAMSEVLAAAKEFYSVQWQMPPSRTRDAPASEKAAEADDVNEPYWLAHERQNVNEDPRPLKDEIVRQSLSMLGRTPNRSMAYLRSDLSGLGLTSLDALRPFKQLQFVNVSRNQLRSLEPLGALRSMLQLNASHNVLMRTDCFTAPDYLEVVDFSYNMIGELGDWTVHKYLRELNLRGNFISKLGTGLLQNKELRILDLSENHISRIENLDGLQLAMLHMAQNRLSSLEGVAFLSGLHNLNVRHNSITSISALTAQDVPRLRKLCLSDNRISQISEVEKLQSFECLADLLMDPNPVVELPYYRSQVLHRLPKLRSLDAEPVTAEEKVKADLIYGVDIEVRKQIFDELLPKESFVDRRLITEEQISEMELGSFAQQGDAGPYGSADKNQGLPAAGRSRMQEAKFRQRLAVVRLGGQPAGIADFQDFAAPCVAIAVHDEDLPAICEAAEQGGAIQLLLGKAKLTAKGVKQIVSRLNNAPGKLRRVQLSGCPVVGQLEQELNSTFPFGKGFSLVATDCGLSAAAFEKLQSRIDVPKKG